MEIPETPKLVSGHYIYQCQVHTGINQNGRSGQFLGKYGTVYASALLQLFPEQNHFHYNLFWWHKLSDLEHYIYQVLFQAK